MAVIKLDSPNSKVNTLNVETMTEVKEIMNLVTKDPNIKAAVLMSGIYKRCCVIIYLDIQASHLNFYWNSSNGFYLKFYLLGKPGCFIAGADISMLQKCQSAEEASKLSKGVVCLVAYMYHNLKLNFLI